MQHRGGPIHAKLPHRLIALIIRSPALTHDATHPAIALGGLKVLAAGLVHDAETFPAVLQRFRRSHGRKRKRP